MSWVRTASAVVVASGRSFRIKVNFHSRKGQAAKEASKSGYTSEAHAKSEMNLLRFMIETRPRTWRTEFKCPSERGDGIGAVSDHMLSKFDEFMAASCEVPAKRLCESVLNCSETKRLRKMNRNLETKITRPQFSAMFRGDRLKNAGGLRGEIRHIAKAGEVETGEIGAEIRS